MKITDNSFRKGLETLTTVIGSVLSTTVGIKRSASILEKAEQFLNHKSQQLEAFIDRTLQRQHQKETIRQDIEELPVLPPHRVKTHTSLDKGLSKDDVLKRLAEIDRMILSREIQQNIEHKR